jgi:hypothetical protein
MVLTLADLKPGDVLQTYHDAGSGGASLCFARVLKVGAKKVRVVGEYGHETWQYPEFFTGKVADRDVAELRADGVTI